MDTHQSARHGGLYVLFNADYVITDSYHIMIYAILARKPFIAYSRINTSIRLRNLLEDLGLTAKFFPNDQDGFEEILQVIDYEKVFEKINTWRPVSTYSKGSPKRL